MMELIYELWHSLSVIQKNLIQVRINFYKCFLYHILCDALQNFNFKI